MYLRVVIYSTVWILAQKRVITPLGLISQKSLHYLGRRLWICFNVEHEVKNSSRKMVSFCCAMVDILFVLILR